MTQDERERRGLLLAFLRALQTHGAPAHRLEREAGAVARTLGIAARFFSTPTMVMVSFGPDEVDATAHVLRIEQGEVDLGRLVEIDELGSAICSSDEDAADAAAAAATLGTAEIVALRQRAERLAEKRPVGGIVRGALSALASSAASASAAALMGGGVFEMQVAAGIGLLVGLLALATSGSEPIGRLHLALSGALAAGIAGAVASSAPLALTLVTVAGVITLVPGLTLTVAMTELSTGHLASGSARSFAALTSLLQLGFGSLLGASVAARLGEPVAAPVGPVQVLPIAVAVLVGGLAFARLLQARRRELPLVVGAAALAVVAARLGEQAAAGVPGVFLASAIVGVAGNAASRLLRKPASLVLIPGILMLVPGSLGFRSLAELLAGDVLAGVARALSVGMIAIALASGQIVAHGVVPPRREL
ncbi:MAG: threonine/serine exporter family protein [Deltaproteobacteria bacterium]|nr:threonine/serine exporter family protein [Deltaproteobacteria bacterium]